MPGLENEGERLHEERLRRERERRAMEEEAKGNGMMDQDEER